MAVRIFQRTHQNIRVITDGCTIYSAEKIAERDKYFEDHYRPELIPSKIPLKRATNTKTEKKKKVWRKVKTAIQITARLILNGPVTKRMCKRWSKNPNNRFCHPVPNAN